MRLQHGESNVAVLALPRLRGPLPIHCHNTLHEDHAMMMRFDIDATGDTKQVP